MGRPMMPMMGMGMQRPGMAPMPGINPTNPQYPAPPPSMVPGQMAPPPTTIIVNQHDPLRYKDRDMKLLKKSKK